MTEHDTDVESDEKVIPIRRKLINTNALVLYSPYGGIETQLGPGKLPMAMKADAYKGENAGMEVMP